MSIDEGGTLDEIEEAFEEAETRDELLLSHLSIHCESVQFMVEQWHRQQRIRQQRPIERIQLEACSFANAQATVHFLRFLQLLGPALKEVFITDTYVRANEFLLDDRAGSLLCGIHVLGTLERLAVDKSNLCGTRAGVVLERVLAHSSNLQVLRFNDCQVDDESLQLFCQGLQKMRSGRLRHLDIDGWYLNDDQLALLVEVLIAPSSQCPESLEFLDLSRSDITSQSFGTLAKLLRHCGALQELVLMDCPTLFVGVGSEPTSHSLYQSFADELRSNQTLKELRLGECHITLPVAAVLVDASNDTLQVLDMGDDVSFVRPNTAEPSREKTTMPLRPWKDPQEIDTVSCPESQDALSTKNVTAQSHNAQSLVFTRLR